MKGEALLELVKRYLDDPGYSQYDEINTAYRKCCKLTKFFWLRKNSESLLSFQSGMDNYQLDFSTIRVLTALYVQGGTDLRWTMMEECDPALFESKVRDWQDRNANDTTSRPLIYKLEGGPMATVTINPVPDQAYSVRVDYIEHTPTISKETVVNLPADHRDSVAALAASYVLERLSDPERKQYGQVLQQRALGEFGELVRDSTPNRIGSIDRKPMRWIR